MTGREKIEAALSPDGIDDVPAVICYERIFIRDHWAQVTDCPWWYWGSPDIEHEVRWRTDAIERIGQEWFRLRAGPPRERRESLVRCEEPDGVYEVDRRSGHRRRLEPFTVGRWPHTTAHESIHPPDPPTSREMIDARIAADAAADPTRAATDGSGDLADRLLAGAGETLYPFEHVLSPLWACYDLWGFEGLMMQIVDAPELVAYACGRFLENALRQVQAAAARGCAGIWIEECMTDMLHPTMFETVNLPYLRELIGGIRSAGMASVYYFSGNPAGKLDLALGAGADALSLEESKKGFAIDIQEVAEVVDGRCALLGNLDAVGVLQDGTEAELRDEVQRQLAAGRTNRHRFVMSLGSPVTPATPLTRVRRYCDMVHEMGTA